MRPIEEEFLAKKGIPHPDKPVEKIVYRGFIQRGEIWALLTDKTWLFFDQRDKIWRPAMYGPL